MPETTRPDLATADGVEVTEYLMDLGWTAIRTQIVADGPAGTAMLVTADGAGDLDAALDAFAPTSEQGSYKPQLPPAIRAHAGHLREFEQAIRTGTPVTAAQTQHVLADVITYLRLTEDRL